MRDRVDRTEERVQRLEAACVDLTRRVAALEDAWRYASTTEGTPLPGPPASRTPAARTADVASVLPLTGRILVVFAGAYLLRAVTEGGTLPEWAGVSLGLVYAGFWLVWASHRGARHDRLGAELYGAAALAIALPLLWEAVTPRQMLTGAGSAWTLGAIMALALAVAWRRRLQGLAWIATAGGLVSGSALLVQTGNVAAFTIVFIVLGVATLWLGYDRDWYGLRWPTALAADVAVLGLTARALAPQTGEPAAIAIGAQFLLLATYLTTIAARTIVRGRAVIPFEVVQAAAAVTVGLGGAMFVTSATGVGTVAVGVGAMVMGAGCYTVAFAFIAQRQGRGINFYFYTSLALALTMVGTQRVLAAPPRVLTWCALAVFLTWLGHRSSRVTLAAHGAVCATAAAFESGFLGTSVAAFFSPPTEWAPIGPLFWAVLATAGAAIALPRPSGDDWGTAANLPRFACAALLIAGSGGLLMHQVVGMLPGSTAAAGNATATIRTGIIAGSAVVLALAGRRQRWNELGWFVYPVLVAGGAKLLIDDLRHSSAAMLVVALALYGGALILAPRVARARGAQVHAKPPEAESTA